MSNKFLFLFFLSAIYITGCRKEQKYPKSEVPVEDQWYIKGNSFILIHRDDDRTDTIVIPGIWVYHDGQWTLCISDS